MPPIADCFASLRAKVGVPGVAGVPSACITPPKNTATPHAAVGVWRPMLPEPKQLPHLAGSATPATPKTPVHYDDDEYWQDMFEERAAIMEFDGGLPRNKAEQLAKQLVDAMRLVAHRH